MVYIIQFVISTQVQFPLKVLELFAPPLEGGAMQRLPYLPQRSKAQQKKTNFHPLPNTSKASKRDVVHPAPCSVDTGDKADGACC